MCGICGQYNYSKKNPVIKKNIQRMADQIIHRGPDDEGIYLNGEIGLGFRRLSIIDIEGGHQPMSDFERNIWIVFNGEIYNYRVLRKQLQSLGHKFKTRSDTEVIIYGYKEWGIDVLNHLNGMFAIALWDNLNKKFYLVRDKFGIKIVYYSIDNQKIIFASELKSILEISRNNSIRPNYISLFLQYRFIPSPYTIYEDIKKLGPGEFLLIENGKYKIERWRKSKHSVKNSVPDVNTAIQNLRSIYESAVERHMISDVPLGLLLSGGVDSALLLAIMSSRKRNLPTFTVGFGGMYEIDELSLAKRSAEYFNSKNFGLTITKDQFERSIAKVIKTLEEPVAASSIIPMYFLCELARREVKVALVGQGPDELFAGYKRHLGARYHNYLKYFPTELVKTIKLIPRIQRNESIRRGLNYIEENKKATGILEKYLKLLSLVSDGFIQNIFLDNLIDENRDLLMKNAWDFFNSNISEFEYLNGLQYIEIRSTLPDELLMYTDKLSMAHSLEVRVPYLDSEIVEYAETLPSNYKIKFGIQKWIHKKVSESYLPKEIINRKKLGFQTPIDLWFKNSLFNNINDHFYDPQSFIFSYLDQKKIIEILEMHNNNYHDFSKLLFNLILLEEWFRQFS